MKTVPRGDANQKNHLEQDICIHIFTVSSAMVGVCLTVIGLVRVVVTLGKADTLADDCLAMDALLFLTSCLLPIGRSALAGCVGCIDLNE
jgi:branched-subunit amino acid permease